MGVVGTCPDCGSPGIMPAPDVVDDPDTHGRYRCPNCGATPFDVDYRLRDNIGDAHDH